MLYLNSGLHKKVSIERRDQDHGTCSQNRIILTGNTVTHLMKQKSIFPVLEKGRDDREEWDEIREKLVEMGTDIYNKINESGL